MEQVLLYSFAIMSAWVILSGCTSNQEVQQAINNSDGQNSPVTEQTTLSGEYVCLPHRDTSGPTTMECTFGLLSDGDHYALDTASLTESEQRNINVGDQITVTGTLTPLSQVTADSRIRIYDIVGVVDVATLAVESEGGASSSSPSPLASPSISPAPVLNN